MWHDSCVCISPGGTVLDAYFKKYFWTFILLVIFAAAFLSARTVNAFLGQALMPTPESLTKGRSGKPLARNKAKAAEGIALSAFLDRNLFNAAREDIEPKAEVNPAEAEAPKEHEGAVDIDNCKPSSLGANLLATFVDDRRPDESMAIFQDTTAAKKTHGVRKGDQLLDQAKVLAIEWRNVFISNGGRCESFSLESAKKKAARAAARPAAAADKKDKSGLGDGVAKVSDNEYTIPRQEIDNVLSNLNKVATQARIVPSFHNGKANGFKLFSIRPNSLYSKIGIQNGDIVQKINGYEINSPDKALEIYSKLKDAQSITVDLVRRGKSQTLSYSIR